MRGRVATNKPGDRIGQWTLLRRIPGRASPRILALWECRCACGKEVEVQASNLTAGKSLSCGHDKGAVLADWRSRRAANDQQQQTAA